MYRFLQSILLPSFLSRLFDSVSDQSSNAQVIVEAAQRTYHGNIIAALHEQTVSGKSECTLDNVSVRRAWDDISIGQRLDYINAVKCVMAMPPRTNPDPIGGIRTHYDDFVWIHINQTEFTHGSALLLPWHRQFIWGFERTLRNECNYTGSLPYWAWERHTANQSLSPTFEDSPWSFGGDGSGPDECLTTGAFKSHIVNLLKTPNGTVYHPHCIRRNFNQTDSTTDLNHDLLASLYQTRSIVDFRPHLETSIHGGSHHFLGKEAWNLWSSPNDPIFWLLHSQIDRIWTIWQRLDWKERETALYGTQTMLNHPPSENATLNSPMTMGVAGGNMKIGDAMDSIGGRYCYMYD